jgi:hypothetical protein
MFFTSEKDTNYDRQSVCEKIARECTTLVTKPKKGETIPTPQKMVECMPAPKMKKTSCKIHITAKKSKFSIS